MESSTLPRVLKTKTEHEHCLGCLLVYVNGTDPGSVSSLTQMFEITIRGGLTDPRRVNSGLQSSFNLCMFDISIHSTSLGLMCKFRRIYCDLCREDWLKSG